MNKDKFKERLEAYNQAKEDGTLDEEFPVILPIPSNKEKSKSSNCGHCFNLVCASCDCKCHSPQPEERFFEIKVGENVKADINIYDTVDDVLAEPEEKPFKNISKSVMDKLGIKTYVEPEPEELERELDNYGWAFMQIANCKNNRHCLCEECEIEDLIKKKVLLNIKAEIRKAEERGRQEIALFVYDLDYEDLQTKSVNTWIDEYLEALKK